MLGPLLFLLFINDLPNATEFFTSLFANNTGLFMSDISQFDLIDRSDCEPNKRYNTRKREIRRIGLLYRPYIDENNFLKMYISVTKVSYKIQIVIGVHAYK